MSKFKFLVVLFSLMPVVASHASDDITARIHKVGTVCIEGQACADATAAPMEVAASGSSVESNFSKSCATCHYSGVAGAPKFGDAAAWESRIAKGMDTLYSSTINGLQAMPAKGMCFSCSDDDLRDLVDYMVSSAQ
ncbi:MAG: cytochrome c5 [Candidatus Azotimanducaceae bacterium]